MPDYYERTSTLGVISSMQSSHAVGDSQWAEDRVGPERKHAGGRLLINTDLPGEPWMPVQTLYFAVTRKNLEGSPAEGWYADQALTVEEALHAMTLAGADAAFQEEMLGSITTGKFADFVELDQDPRQMTSDALKDIKALRTWVAGKVVAISGFTICSWHSGQTPWLKSASELSAKMVSKCCQSPWSLRIFLQ